MQLRAFLARIMPICNTVVWLLVLCVFLLILQQLQSTIFTPLCALPFLRSSDVCRAVQLLPNGHWCSATPLMSSTNWCQTIGQTNKESSAKVERFTPAVINDIHELLMALDDLTSMVEQSSLRRHALLCGQLKLVVETGLACKNEVQEYASQLSGALKLVINAADFTLSIMKSSVWLPQRNQAEAKLAFHRTLRTFNLYIHDLVRSGNQTSMCMGTLDNNFYAAKYLLTETRRLTEQEIDHLLGIRSYLGGNRSLLVDARARLKVLTAGQIQTKTIHKMIWDAQAHLKELEINSQILRTFASAPRIAGDSSREAMHGLSSGCRNMYQLLFSSQRLSAASSEGDDHARVISDPVHANRSPVESSIRHRTITERKQTHGGCWLESQRRRGPPWIDSADNLEQDEFVTTSVALLFPAQRKDSCSESSVGGECRQTDY
ncbi:hypothetical protein B0H10DRAFT_2393755 [Mycena sp. CBHHK59/15]|nr:hypothetical protein B0H10DRAFT_2393755 [Mycena sp. CBHHK59/15]